MANTGKFDKLVLNLLLIYFLLLLYKFLFPLGSFKRIKFLYNNAFMFQI